MCIGNFSKRILLYTAKEQIDIMCNQRIMSVLTVFYIILFLWQTVEANNFFMFRSDSVFDGYRCSPNKTIYQTLERNILECAETCYVNSFCYSFSYQKESGICVGCAGYYHNSEILIGSSYFGRYCKLKVLFQFETIKYDSCV